MKTYLKYPREILTELLATSMQMTMNDNPLRNGIEFGNFHKFRNLKEHLIIQIS